MNTEYFISLCVDRIITAAHNSPKRTRICEQLASVIVNRREPELSHNWLIEIMEDAEKSARRKIRRDGAK